VDPEAATLNVHVLPTRRLDVRVRDVVGAHSALASDLTPSHSGPAP
jgi:hypothetical protein